MTKDQLRDQFEQQEQKVDCGINEMKSEVEHRVETYEEKVSHIIEEVTGQIAGVLFRNYK